MAKGYAIADPKKWTEFQVIDFDLKPEEADDVTVAIDCAFYMIVPHVC